SKAENRGWSSWLIRTCRDRALRNDCRMADRNAQLGRHRYRPFQLRLQERPFAGQGRVKLLWSIPVCEVHSRRRLSTPQQTSASTTHYARESSCELESSRFGFPTSR